MAEQLFASFILDREQGLEIAIAAKNVTEATPITEKILPLPASVSFLEGIMYLRDAVIPVLNMKKRMGLTSTSKYGKGAKIAVVMLANQHFGLLFDDIHEVLRVDESLLMPIQPVLQSENCMISDLITLKEESRTIKVIDLKKLFIGEPLLVDQEAVHQATAEENVTRTYSRYVIFSSGGTEYGIPVDNSRELTFVTDIDDTFKTGHLEGALQLRGNTIPVMNASMLLHDNYPDAPPMESSRILVLTTDALDFGITIDDIREILTICNEEIMPTPKGEDDSVTGIFEPQPGRNIMLLDVVNLVASQMGLLKSMAKIRTETEEETTLKIAESKHLITENCYLIFSIGTHFALELKNIQEIIEHNDLLTLPGASGFDSKILNLRGQIIPVVNLRKFYGYEDQPIKETNSRLIICREQEQVIALQVDNIITIYKQEKFHNTPSLNPQLQPREDTLDRLIEFIGEEGIKKHVLVVNTANISNNHLQTEYTQAIGTTESETEIEHDTGPSIKLEKRR